jgi:hypothetical protein
MVTGSFSAKFLLFLFGLSVVLIVFFPTAEGREGAAAVLTGLLILCSAVAACFETWSVERSKLLAIQEKLEPRLRLKFDPTHTAFMHSTKWDEGDVLVIHVLPTCDAPIDGVSGSLVAIERLSEAGAWEPTEFNEPIPLSWSYPNTEGPKTLFPKPASYLNALFIFNRTPVEIVPGAYGLRYPRRMAGVLNAGDTFRVNICVTGSGHAFAEIFIKFRLGQQWDKPEILEHCT